MKLTTEHEYEREQELNEIISQALPDMNRTHSRTNTMSGSPSKRVHSLLLCQICYERFQLPQKAPKVLPCQHSFCIRCMACLVKGETIRCPMCRTTQAVPSEGITGFPTNLTIISLLDCYCTLCQNDDNLEQCAHCDKPICLDCKEFHAEQMSEHALKKLQQLSEEKDTLECLCRDMAKYSRVIKEFIRKSKLEQAKSATDNEIVQGMCRYLESEIQSTIPLTESSQQLLETIEQVITGDRDKIVGDGCGCKPDERLLCNDNCDGGCEDQQETSGCCSGTQGSKGCADDYCNPPAVIKELNKHLKDATAFNAALNSKSNTLSKFTECFIRRQINYLASIEAKFAPPQADGITLVNHQFQRPSFVASCSTNNCFYVLDQGDNTITRIDSTEGGITKFKLDEDANSTQGEYTGLAITREGQMLVTDSTNGRINVYDQDGSLVKRLGSLGTKNGQLKAPMGLTCDDEDNIHVCDWGNQRMQVINLDGTFVRTYGEIIAENDIFRPQFVHIAGENVYVSDTQGSQIYIFGDQGQVIKAIEPESDFTGHSIPDLVWPSGITSIRHGYVLVADWSSCTINVLSPSGEYICRWAGSGDALGQFDCPKGVAFCKDSGLIAVCDTMNNRVQVIHT